jgi:GntR family transcriptional regulator
MVSPPASSCRPVYLKLRDQIAAAILDGTYAEGALLPSVRAYAAAEAANPLTVAKAYQQFQNEGLVQVQRGIGMFVVAGAAEALRSRERESFLCGEWPQIAARIRRLHIDPAGLLADIGQT